MDLNNIKKPTLLVDINRVRANIKHMCDKAVANDCIFRPHFKTHQSAGIGQIFREYGVSKITVTSVEMAKYFADNGWDDITIAIPVNLREIEEVNELAARIELSLIVDSEYSEDFLSKNLEHNTDVWIEINNGYNRSGILFEETKRITKMAMRLDACKKITYKGLLSHFENTYSAKKVDRINAIFTESIDRLENVKKLIDADLGDGTLISIGDTPACTLIEDLSRADEMRPGNFVFYDLMQLKLGVCSESDIAVALACPVISIDKARGEFVLYAGAVHLSKDFIEIDGVKSFGAIASLNPNGWGKIWDKTNIKSLSQEHAVVKTSTEILDSVKIGDLVAVIPVHSCLTADSMGKYTAIDGENIEMARFR